LVDFGVVGNFVFVGYWVIYVKLFNQIVELCVGDFVVVEIVILWFVYCVVGYMIVIFDYVEVIVLVF